MDEARKFSIADGLLLIAGVALSLSCVNATLRDDLLKMGSLPGPALTWNFIGSLTELSLIFGLPALATWTPFCLLLQAKKPRPRWRRLRRQPGFVANLLASAVTASTVATVAILDSLSIWGGGNWFVNRYAKAYVLLGVVCGAAVLWSWAGLWASGGFRVAPSWKDKLGLANGAGWVVLGSICAYFVCEKL